MNLLNYINFLSKFINFPKIYETQLKLVFVVEPFINNMITPLCTKTAHDYHLGTAAATLAPNI